MKDIKLRIRSVRKHHADHQGHGAGGHLQAAHAPRSARSNARPYFRGLAPAADATGRAAAKRILHSLRAATPWSEEHAAMWSSPGDRGLAGGYNANLFKALQRSCRAGRTRCVLPMGKQGRGAIAQRRGLAMLDRRLSAGLDGIVGSARVTIWRSCCCDGYLTRASMTSCMAGVHRLRQHA